MSEQEIRAKYAARKCETQIEFDRLMSELNEEQSHLNHPYLDKKKEVMMQRENIKLQIQALRQQDTALKMQQMEFEQKQKENNRIFHDLKHELIMLNPRDQYVKPVEQVTDNDSINASVQE